MAKVSPTCDCGSHLPNGKPHSQERFLHNTSKEHRLAVLKQVGCPEPEFTRTLKAWGFSDAEIERAHA